MLRSSPRIKAYCAVLLLTTACGDSKDKNAATDFTVAESLPSDTTGTSGTMNLNFASGDSLALQQDGTPLAIGTDIEISYAKFNLAKIRVKASKEPSTDEKTLESLESVEEKSSVKEVETETGTDDASQLAGGRKPARDRKAERAAKIAEKKARLDAREKASIERETARDKGTKWSGPYVFDAVAGKIEGDVPAISLADGSYRRIEFQLKRNFSAAQSEALLGNVFAIRGTVLKAGDKVPFEIDWHVAMNLRLSGEGAVSVKPNDDNSLHIKFDLSKWFEGIDLAAATVDEDGTIYISKNSNKEIMKQIHRNIKINARFGKDANDNGKLDDSEVAGKGEDTVDPAAE